MAQHDSLEDPPVTLFQAAYSVASWVSLAFLAGVLAWLIVTLFSNTRPGTAKTQALAMAEPTLVALAEGIQAASGGCPPLEIPPACAACHAIAGFAETGVLGPELTYVRTVAAERISSPDYTGSATSAEEYVRESILEPNAYLVPGEGYRTPRGASIMPAAVGEALAPAELEALVRALSCVPED